MDDKSLADLTETMTGFSAACVTKMSDLLGFDRKDVIAALSMMHSNFSNAYLPFAMFPFINRHLCESSWRYRVEKVFHANDAVALHNEDERFLCRDELFPEVTGIVDGVPVYCHGPRDYYSGKNHQKSVSFQVGVTLDGKPLFKLPPVRGSQHDSKSFRVDPFLSGHRSCELLLADKAYMNNAHCLAPYKIRSNSSETIDSQKKLFFNRVHSHRRARVERFFAYLDRHKFMHYCRHKKEWIASAFHLMWNAEVLKSQSNTVTLRYPNTVTDADSVPILSNLNLQHPCTCDFSTKAACIDGRRDALRDKFWSMRDRIEKEIEPKAPGHTRREAIVPEELARYRPKKRERVE